MKVIFSFNLPDEEELFNVYRKAQSMSIALEEIENLIFRPPYKHGFDDEKLNHLYKNKQVKEYHELLSKKFYQILSEID